MAVASASARLIMLRIRGISNDAVAFIRRKMGPFLKQAPLAVWASLILFSSSSMAGTNRMAMDIISDERGVRIARETGD